MYTFDCVVSLVIFPTHRGGSSNKLKCFMPVLCFHFNQQLPALPICTVILLTVIMLVMTLPHAITQQLQHAYMPSHLVAVEDMWPLLCFFLHHSHMYARLLFAMCIPVVADHTVTV